MAGQSTRLVGKLNPDGTRVAAFHTMPGDRTTVLKFWDAETGTLLWSVPVPVDTGGYEYLDFSADGRRLVTARDFGTGSLPGDRHVEVHVWDTASGKPIYTNDFPASRRVGFPSLSADGTRSPVKSCSAWLRPMPGIFR